VTSSNGVIASDIFWLRGSHRNRWNASGITVFEWKMAVNQRITLPNIAHDISRERYYDFESISGGWLESSTGSQWNAGQTSNSFRLLCTVCKVMFSECTWNTSNAWNGK